MFQTSDLGLDYSINTIVTNVLEKHKFPDLLEKRVLKKIIFDLG